MAEASTTHAPRVSRDVVEDYFKSGSGRVVKAVLSYAVLIALTVIYVAPPAVDVVHLLQDE